MQKIIIRSRRVPNIDSDIGANGERGRGNSEVFPRVGEQAEPLRTGGSQREASTGVSLRSFTFGGTSVVVTILALAFAAMPASASALRFSDVTITRATPERVTLTNISFSRFSTEDEETEDDAPPQNGEDGADGAPGEESDSVTTDDENAEAETVNDGPADNATNSSAGNDDFENGLPAATDVAQAGGTGAGDGGDGGRGSRGGSVSAGGSTTSSSAFNSINNTFVFINIPSVFGIR